MTESFEWMKQNTVHLPSSCELFNLVVLDRVADGATTEKVFSVIYIFGKIQKFVLVS